MRTNDLIRRAYAYKESRGIIISQTKEAVESGIRSIEDQRRRLEKYVQAHPTYQYTLEPVSIENAPRVAYLMAEAGRKAGVGPMAAVAGVLAELAVEEMLNHGVEVAIVENGGEASLYSNKPVDVALKAGDMELSRRIGFRIERFPAGIATSSAIYSHALSLGEAEAVTIFTRRSSDLTC